MYDLHGLECSFIHRTIIGLIPGGGVVNTVLDVAGTVFGATGGGGGSGMSPEGQRRQRRIDEVLSAAHVSAHARGIEVGPHSAHGHTPGVIAARQAIAAGVGSGFAPNAPSSGPCIWPTRRDPVTGNCRVFLGDQSGPDNQPIGDAVMGRYGAAEVPGSRIIDRAVCRRGTVLGDDGLCYNRRDISNKQRMWPKERRPLMTGGDLNAITKANRAAKRLQGKQKQLQAMGMLKKPSSSRRRPHQHLLAAPAVVNVE